MNKMQKLSAIITDSIETNTAQTNSAQTIADKFIYKGVETPAYKLIEDCGAIQIRRYEPILTAEVTLEGARKKVANEGFWILASYIFGKNSVQEKIEMNSPVAQSKASTKIEMTAPVRQSERNGSWTIQFAMPSKFTLESLPAAQDPRIRFRNTEPSMQAVICFSGIASNKAIAKQTELLQDFLNSRGLAASNEPSLYFYDSPFTLPWNRRNEIAIEIGQF